jgi:hypothetical protein
VERNGINNRQRVVATLAVIHNGLQAIDLTAFVTEQEKKALQAVMEAHLRLEPSEREFKLRQLIQSQMVSEQWSGLAEVHPAWILEELKNESPRIIGIILRYLPSRHVRYLLEHLPPTIRFAIPNVVEAFSVPQPILDVIRRCFESRFAPLHLSRSADSFGFDQLYYLRGSELEIFFRDLGLQELAMALHGLSGKSLTILLNRLSLRDAKRLQQRMRSLENISDALTRQARYTVLDVEGEHLGPEHLLLEIGLAAFARSVAPEHGDLFRMLEIKLDPLISYVLKRHINERLEKNTRVVAEERQAIVLSRVADLARENLIDQSWSRFFPQEA